MTINNKSERNYRGKCLGWPFTSYGGGKCENNLITFGAKMMVKWPLIPIIDQAQGPIPRFCP